jgi:hypothetical protein
MTAEPPEDDAWAELEALAAALRAADEHWRSTSEAMAAQLELVRNVREQVDQHYAELAIEAQLERLARSLLNDAARLHAARLDYGLTRTAMLIWHPLDDPRPALREVSPEAQYAIEVRIGPRYLLRLPGGGAADERLSILIAGEKRLVATLPTTREKLRAALLRAFEAPAYSGPPREQPAGEPASPDQTDTGGAATAEQPGREAEHEAEATATMSDTSAEAGSADGAAAIDDGERSDAEQPRKRKPRTGRRQNAG